MKASGILIGIMTMITICCQNQEQREQKQTVKATEVQKPSYQTALVVKKDISETIQLPGEFRANQEVKLYPKANGFVEKVFVDLGSVVKKGQVLITVDAPEVEEQLISARSKYLRAEALFIASKNNYKRMMESAKTPGAVSGLDIEMAQSKMLSDSATVMGEKANFRALEKMKYYMNVRAPFNGVITERHVHPGSLVGPGSKNEFPMLVLQEQSKLRLVVDIPENYSNKVGKGSEIKFMVSTFPEREFKGKVSRSSGSMNTSFRSETLEIDIDNKAGRFKPGMFAEVLISAGSSPGASVVPSSAIVTSTEKQYIIKLDSNKTKFIEVKLGIKSNEMIEVFGEVDINDTVIVNASSEIREGIVINS